MTKQKLLFSIILLGAILGYLKFVEFPAEDQEISKDKIFNGIDSTEIEAVNISSAGTNVFLVNLFPHSKPANPDPSVGELSDQKEEDFQWKLKNIPNAILDPARVNALMSSIETLQSEARISQNEVEEDLSIYGLKPAELTLEVLAKGARKKLEFGKLNDFVGKRYLRVDDGAELLMVSNSLFESASKKESDFRDKTPISFGEDSVSELKVWSPSGEFSVLKQGDEWKIQNPSVRASAAIVYGAFRNLRNLEATNYIDDREKDRNSYGLTAPKVRYSLSPKSKEPLLVEIGSAGGKYFMQLNSAGTIYELSKDPSLQLPVSVPAFRERKFLNVDSYLINRVKITKADGKSFLLTKKDEKWSIDGAPSDETFVKEYLSALESLTAVDFPTNISKIGKVILAVEIESKNVKEMDGKPEAKTLIIGDEGEKGFLAGLQGIEELYLVGKEAVSKLNANSERFMVGSQPSTGNS